MDLINLKKLIIILLGKINFIGNLIDEKISLGAQLELN